MAKRKTSSQCMHIDYQDPHLKEKVKELVPIEGICIFIDICGSTALKYEGPSFSWIYYIKNTFEKCVEHMPEEFRPINIIGDALYYFITKEQLQETGVTALDVFEGLVHLVRQEADEYYKPVKVGVAYCKNIYNITFFEGRCDFYGSGIDFTSRLLSISSDQEIIMDSAFYKMIKKDYDDEGGDVPWIEYVKIYGPMPMKFKGFENYRMYYKYRASKPKKEVIRSDKAQ